MKSNFKKLFSANEEVLKMLARIDVGLDGVEDI
jgi:hypothetical protein